MAKISITTSKTTDPNHLPNLLGEGTRLAGLALEQRDDLDLTIATSRGKVTVKVTQPKPKREKSDVGPERPRRKRAHY